MCEVGESVCVQCSRRGATAREGGRGGDGMRWDGMGWDGRWGGREGIDSFVYAQL